MVKIAKIGSGCTVKSVCDLDREIADAKSRIEGKYVEPEGSCHFSYGKLINFKEGQYFSKFNHDILGELFSEIEDYDIRPGNPPGKYQDFVQVN